MATDAEKYKRLVYRKELRLFRTIVCNALAYLRYGDRTDEISKDAYELILAEFYEIYPEYDKSGR